MSASKIARYLESLTQKELRTLRAEHFQSVGGYADNFEICRWALEQGYDKMAYIHDAEDLSTTAMKTAQTAKQAARSGIDITGKKMRIVFGKGRDLNIFNVQTMNVDGQWWRITDGDGHLYVIDPKKVNYTETK